ncbi:MAG: glutamate racemase [Limnobacter sp.]|nr:glutamate racemase [Limnobacter sp.]
MKSVKGLIGVTDSGVGGLSVLAHALDVLPNERFLFFADQAFIPYGDKPVHEIVHRVQRVATWFHEHDCKALVLACNTATAAAAEPVRHQYAHWPVVGIEPAVKPAALMTQSGKVGILATANTLTSERFKSLVARFETVAEVVAQPCKGLVELIEVMPMNHEAIVELLKPNVQILLNAGVDVIVLGCTHYPFVREHIQKLAGQQVQVIDTGIPVARHLHTRLKEANLLVEQAASSLDCERVHFYTTGQPQLFKQAVVGLLGAQWQNAQVSHLNL